MIVSKQKLTEYTGYSRTCKRPFIKRLILKVLIFLLINLYKAATSIKQPRPHYTMSAIPNCCDLKDPSGNVVSTLKFFEDRDVQAT